MFDILYFYTLVVHYLTAFETSSFTYYLIYKIGGKLIKYHIHFSQPLLLTVQQRDLGCALGSSVFTHAYTHTDYYNSPGVFGSLPPHSYLSASGVVQLFRARFPLVPPPSEMARRATGARVTKSSPPRCCARTTEALWSEHRYRWD